jgi:hypothetical protein
MPQSAGTAIDRECTQSADDKSSRRAHRSAARSIMREESMHASVASRWLAMSCLALLAACGGDGGGDSSNPSLAFSPATVSGNVQQGEVGTLTTSVTVRNADKITGDVWIYAEDGQQVLSNFNIAGIDAAHFSVTVQTSPALSAGHHRGALGIHVCKDVHCGEEWMGVTSLAYDINVVAGPLQAAPVTATTSTVPWQGTDTDVLRINVTGGTTWTISSGAAWLVNTGAPTGTSPATASFAFATQQLAQGDYATDITVRSSDGAQVVEIPVTLHVVPPVFAIDAGGSPVFTAVNGAPIAQQAFSFELDNGVAVPWSLQSSASWLEASATSGTTPANLLLTADPSMGPLASGGYDGTLTLSSSAAASKSVTAHLQLIQPTLSLAVPSVTFGGNRGRDLGTSQAVQLTLNTGTNAYPVSLSSLPSWLSITPAQPTASQSGTVLTLAPNVANITAGSSSEAIVLTSTVNGDTVTTPLTVNVNADQRRLLPSSWGVAFASSPVGSVTTRTLQVRDNFGGTLPWTATSDSAWLSATAGGSTGGTSTLVLTADPSRVAEGSVSVATVRIATTTPGVSAAVVRVGLWKSSTAGMGMTKLNGTSARRLVADKIRPYVYAHDGGGSITVYNAYTAAAVGTISNVGATLGAMAVSPDGSLLYVQDTTAKALRIVDLSTMTSTATWPLASTSSEVWGMLVVRPNGAEVVLLGDGSAYTAGHALPATGIVAWDMSATDDGSKVYTIDNGISPASQAVWTLDYSEISGGTLYASVKAAPFDTGGQSNGAAIAVTPDGSAVYAAAGAPYECVALDPVDMTFVKYLPGADAYPNNVKVTRDGRAICGIDGIYSTGDFWVYSSAGAVTASYKVAGYARGLKESQMVVTADGFVVVVPTDDPLLAFVPIGP